MNDFRVKDIATLTIRKTSKYYFLYVITIFILAFFIWPKIKVSQFSMYNYELNIDFAKTLFCTLISLLIYIYINNIYSNNSSFSSMVILILSILYFIPGLAMCGALSFEWGYIFSYVVYYFVLILADRFIIRPCKTLPSLSKRTVSCLFFFMIALSFTYPFFMMYLFNKTLTLSTFIATLNDPYEVRAAAREKNISYAYLLIEYWGSYFGALMTTYYCKKKNVSMVLLFILVQLFYFVLQGNRIILFTLIISLVLGIKKVNSLYLSRIFFLSSIIQIVEFLMSNVYAIGFFTNSFRRFSVVPNIISPKYYDYFQNAMPDFLRGNYSFISKFLGIASEYESRIGYIIGDEYFNLFLNANTGMIGGAFFEFGFLGILIDPIMIILSLRIFEKVLLNTSKEIKMLIAIIYTSIAINSWVIWSQLLRPSYILLFLFSIYIVFNKDILLKHDQELNIQKL